MSHKKNHQQVLTYSEWRYLNCSSIVTGFNGAEIACNLGILLMNSNCFLINKDFLKQVHRKINSQNRHSRTACGYCFFKTSFKAVTVFHSIALNDLI